jgi:hypothetical protein
VQEGSKVMVKEDWACHYCHVTNTGNSYWEKDTIMNDIIENFIIT